MIEGTLDVNWTNYGEPNATPRYKLLFLKYVGFVNGAQKPKEIVGTANLESYLRSLKISTQHLTDLLKELGNKKSVSLDNFMLDEQQAAEYKNVP